MGKKFIHDNVVEYYLRKNPTKKLSVKKLNRILNISNSQAYYLAMNSKEIRMIEPYEIGSNKTKLYVFTYKPKIINIIDEN